MSQPGGRGVGGGRGVLDTTSTVTALSPVHAPAKAGDAGAEPSSHSDASFSGPPCPGHAVQTPDPPPDPRPCSLSFSRWTECRLRSRIFNPKFLTDFKGSSCLHSTQSAPVSLLCPGRAIGCTRPSRPSPCNCLCQEWFQGDAASSHCPRGEDVPQTQECNLTSWLLALRPQNPRMKCSRANVLLQALCLRC